LYYVTYQSHSFVNVILLPDDGWFNDNVMAWRYRRSHGVPYRLSPLIGHPKPSGWAEWTRNWCVRPV